MYKKVIAFGEIMIRFSPPDLHKITQSKSMNLQVGGGEIEHIVDRVGSGDSFVGGMLYGIQAYQGNWEKILNFAVTTSCLKHSIVGDFNLVSVKEVENVMSGDTSGRVSR